MATELDATSSGWGLSASPLVVDDTVIIGAVGTLAGYDRDTGASRWLAPDGGNSYGSPHPVTIDGVRPVPLLAATGLTSVAPDGLCLRLRRKHSRQRGPRYRPARVEGEAATVTASSALADQDALLVLTEQGDLALVAATRVR